MAQVQFVDVKKVYDGNVVAARDINLTIEDKELLVLVGPSGCGKSTVLRMVAGLEDVSEGQILFDGQVVNDMTPKKRNVAMVFQSYALYPHVSVYDNLAFSLKLRKFSKSDIKKRVQETAEILGIDALLKRKPKALSGGQRQRVALGRAIIRNPSL
ncbi:MAG: ATP-binding cassette domain-containing protein, partial [Candidatus Latescibacterota bacterium]